MNEQFIRLVAALAVCDETPGTDEHTRWTEILKAIYRMTYQPAHEFLARINMSGLPNESPAALLTRAHQHAKQLLPLLLLENPEVKANAATETNYEKYVRREREFDPFLDGANLTRDAYSGKSQIEPEQKVTTDRWGNVVQ